MASLSKVVDVISSNIHLSIKDKQEILEKGKISERAEFLSSWIESQIDLIEVEQRIRGRVRKQMEKSQKEYFSTSKLKRLKKNLVRLERRRVSLMNFK